MNRLNKITYQGKLLFNNTKNPLTLLLFYTGLKKEVTCKFKYDDLELHITSENKDVLGRSLFYYEILKRYKLDNKLNLYKKFLKTINNDVLEIDGVKFFNNNFSPILWEYFMDNPFLRDEMNNRTVIDIGANIGDTALFMAKKGAYVHAFEPIPQTYEIGLKNLSLNPNLEEKIKFYNLAVNGTDGMLEIYFEDEMNSASANSFSKQNKKITAKAVSVKTILEKYDVKPDILKIDCEGAEYDIIEKSDLSGFNKIMIEYHEAYVNKPHDLLINKLKEEGFNIKIEEMPPHSLNEFGFIIASK